MFKLWDSELRQPQGVKAKGGAWQRRRERGCPPRLQLGQGPRQSQLLRDGWGSWGGGGGQESVHLLQRGAWSKGGDRSRQGCL